MPRVHEIDLACKLVNEHFGPAAEHVIKLLLTKGRQTLAELQSSCTSAASNSSTPQPAITRSALKQVLLVLIQQNCVKTYLQPSEVRVNGVRPAYYIYEADLKHILQIVRRPRFLQHIKDDTGNNPGAVNDVSAVIVELLLEHGRLRYDQISRAVVARLAQDAAAAAEQDGDAGEDKTADHAEAVRWSFVQLLQEHYIERAPPCNLPPPQFVSAAVSRAKKAAPKPGSAEYAEAQSKAMQQLQHKTFEEQRFKAPRELVAGAGLDDDTVLAATTAPEAAAAADAKPISKKRKKVAGGFTEESAAAAVAAEAAEAAAANAAVAKQAAALANKRRKTNSGKASKGSSSKGAAAADDEGESGSQQGMVKLEADAAATATPGASSSRKAAAAADDGVEPPSASELLWRVNPDEFNRRFRNKVMVDLVADKLGSDAGTVLAAMLSHGRRYETTVQGDVGIPTGIQEVVSALTAGQNAGRLPHLSPGTAVDALIKALTLDGLGCVQEGTPGPTGATYQVDMGVILGKAKQLQLHAVLRDKFGIHGLRIFNVLWLRGHLEQKQIADTVMQPHKETRELLYKMFKAGYVQMQDIPRTSDRAPSRSFFTYHVNLNTAYERLAGDLHQAACKLHARLSYEMAQHAELVELVESARAAGALNFNMTDGQRKALERLQRVTTALETSVLRLDSMIALFHEY